MKGSVRSILQIDTERSHACGCGALVFFLAGGGRKSTTPSASYGSGTRKPARWNGHPVKPSADRRNGSSTHEISPRK